MLVLELDIGDKISFWCGNCLLVIDNFSLGKRIFFIGVLVFWLLFNLVLLFWIFFRNNEFFGFVLFKDFLFMIIE